MNFFKAFLASCLGIFTSFVLLFLFFLILIISSSSNPQPSVASNSVLTMSLSGDIPARALPDPFEELFNPNAGKQISLETLKENLEKAAVDDDIQGIWVKTNVIAASWANLEAAYEYFENFKNSGKFLYFSTDDIGMNEKSYYLATLADSIFTPPSTNFEFNGFSAQMVFYHDMLNKIGVEPEVFRVGKYKSAIEPFTQTSPSQESREQIAEILEASTSTFVEAVSVKTGKNAEQINDMLNSAPVNRLEYAHEIGLVDAYAFEDEIQNIIKQKLDIKDGEELKTVDFKTYARISPYSVGIERGESFDKVAIIYASGAIMPQIEDSPFNNSNLITAEDFQDHMNKALKNKNVKAVVVHINSPGGAATTSDLLWNSIKKATEKKPVVVSMGSVAASGGYYMAMGADTVVASKNTITGSIGIFNLLFNAQELLNDKMGLNFADVKTHEFADLMDLTDPFTAAESRIIQQNVENGYELFLERVAEGRNMTRDEVHAKAQGRVYTGEAAMKAGLVDVIGDIDDAIAIAAEMAGISDYSTESYPKKKGIMEVLYGSSTSYAGSMLLNFIPDQFQQDVQDISYILSHPANQNWAIMPVKIDAN